MFSRKRKGLEKYKLTEDGYREMLINQHFKCKICERKVIDCGKLEIDHCHKTGRVRGLICHQCNCQLAVFEQGKFNRSSHLVNPKKEFTKYLNTHTDLISSFEREVVRINYANWNSIRRRIRKRSK